MGFCCFGRVEVIVYQPDFSFSIFVSFSHRIAAAGASNFFLLVWRICNLQQVIIILLVALDFQEVGNLSLILCSFLVWLVEETYMHTRLLF